MNLRDIAIRARGHRWRITLAGPDEDGEWTVRVHGPRGVVLAYGADASIERAWLCAVDEAMGRPVPAKTTDGAPAASDAWPTTETPCRGCGVALVWRPGRGRQRVWCQRAECKRASRAGENAARKRPEVVT